VPNKRLQYLSSGIDHRNGLIMSVCGPNSGGKTRCDVPEIRRATEIGFAIHESSRRNGAVVRAR
jgi:hypothetical protein